ncbi:MAG: PD-(D/E)XK nuclease family protein [Chloroflexi bacterium]|nr:PD-(D/E)XK nuclease family protein [Chloroflexota bacterium]
MSQSLLLSQGKLEAFLACRRRFYLRSLRRLPWPAAPLGDESEEALARGQQFHRVMERHFLGLGIAPEEIDDGRVQHWQRQFQASGPAIPDGQLLPEHRLTVPVGRHLLLGRFDLLVVGEADGRAFAHIFDWKTGKARREADLRQNWQTRLYLALLAEGGGALRAQGGNGRSLSPDRVSITYWYAAEPDTPRTIRYTSAWHAQNWADIQAIVAQIDAALAQDNWPLTDDWDECRRCAYQVYCGRQTAGHDPLTATEEEESDELTDLSLEPQTP